MTKRARWISIVRQIAFTPIILGAVGWAVGVLIVYYPYQYQGAEANSFVNDPDFFLWSLVISLEVGIFLMAMPGLASYVCSLKAHRSPHRWWILTNLVVLIALFLVPVVIGQVLIEGLSDWPLENLFWKVQGIVLLAGFTALAGFLVILLVQVASQEISVISNSMQDVLDDFAQRKAYLDRSLFAIGAIIGVGILATGILRDLSLEHIDAVTTENYPKSFVVAYGAYFSIMLALVFVPAQAALTNRGRRILTAWAHLGSIDEPEWETALSKRRTLEQTLHLSGNPLERFQVGISLMAPILGAAVSYVAS